MPFPTTQWGNFTDVYTAIPGPSASTPGSADGPVLGNFSVLADGSAVQFLQFVATTAANKCCQLSAWQNAYQVTPTTAVGQVTVAVNDLSGQSLTANYCAWGKVRGLAFPLAAASTAANAVLATSNTSGTLYTATAGTDLVANFINDSTAVGGGGAAKTPALFIS